MKKQIATALAATTFLTTGALAYQDGCAQENCPNNMKHNKGNYGKMTGKGMHNCGNMGQNMPFMRVMKRLNLTNEQQDQIRSIMQENRQKRQTMSSFFTDNSFDREKYEKFLQEKRDNSVKNRAQNVEKIYALLTDKQKKQFKTLLELQEQRGMQKIKGQ